MSHMFRVWNYQTHVLYDVFFIIGLYQNCQAIYFWFTSPHYKPCLHEYKKELSHFS
jgi:hypothetical protein